MKNYLSLLLILICVNGLSQKAASFNAIDWNTQFIDASTVDTLAYKLTAGYKSDVEKVRSIYSLDHPTHFLQRKYFQFTKTDSNKIYIIKRRHIGMEISR